MRTTEQKTELISSICGNDVNPNTLIQATPIESATQYKFEIRQGSQTQTLLRNHAYIRFDDLLEAPWRTTYRIRIQAKVDNAWGKWGNWCSIRTNIPTTTLDGNTCGLQGVNTNTLIQAIPVLNAQQYKFEVKQGSQVETLYQDNPNFYFGNLSRIPVWNTTYEVRVQAKVKDAWGAWGSSCSITTTAHQMRLDASVCGMRDVDVDTLIRAVAIPDAQQYRFEVRQGMQVETLLQDNAYFYFRELSQTPAWDTIYEVRVQAKVRDAWGTWSTPCSITTTAHKTALDSGSCRLQNVNTDAVIRAIPVSDAQQYKFEIKKGAEIETLLRDSAYFSFGDLLQTPVWDTTYEIRVQAKVKDAWGAWSDSSCYIKTTAQQTTLDSVTCGLQNVNTNTLIQAISIPNAQQYRFEICGLDTLLRDDAYFYFGDVSELVWDTTYNIRVQVKVKDAWGLWGTICSVKTTNQETYFDTVVCGRNDIQLDTKLHIVPISNAEAYHFKLQHLNSKKAQKILRLSDTTWVQLNQFNEIPLQWGKKYRLQTRAKVAGSWGNWGPWCIIYFADDQISMPPSPTPITSTIQGCVDMPFTDSLRVSTPVEGDIIWYSDTIKLDIFGYGATFLPPPLSENTIYYAATHIGNLRSKLVPFYANVSSEEETSILYVGSNSPVRYTEELQLYATVEGNNNAYHFTWYDEMGNPVGQGQELFLPTSGLSGNHFYTVSVSPLQSNCETIEYVEVYVPKDTLQDIPNYAFPDSFAVVSQYTLNEVYYQVYEGKLLFDYWEGYQEGALNCKIYDWRRQQIGKVTLQKQVGLNQYGLDLSGGFCENNQYYTVEMTDGKGFEQIFRFRYESPENLSPSFYAAVPCAEESYQGVLTLEGGETPYHIEIYTAVNDSLTHNYVHEQNPQQSTDTDLNTYEVITNPTVLGNIYYVKVKVKDATGKTIRITRRFTPLDCQSISTPIDAKGIPNLPIEFYHYVPIIQPPVPIQEDPTSKPPH